MKKSLLFILMFMFSIALIGCGQDAKIEEYYKGMQAFYLNVEKTTTAIDLIDENDEYADVLVKNHLNDLLEQFRILSEMEVPKNFAACEQLSDDAYSYMAESVRLYTAYYDNGNYNDTSTIAMAEENYNRAMTRINYISQILQGQMPEGEGIVITEEDTTDFTPVMENEDEEIYEEGIENSTEDVIEDTPQFEEPVEEYIEYTPDNTANQGVDLSN